MSEYKKIHGIHVQALASDPSNLGAGQVWYNTTTNKLKITAVSTSGAWATGGNMATSRQQQAGAGTQTAGLAFGGGFPISNTTEHYDGSAWTAGGNMATARYYLGGTGTLSAGLGFGGYDGSSITNATEEYAGPGIISKTVTSS